MVVEVTLGKMPIQAVLAVVELERQAQVALERPVKVTPVVRILLVLLVTHVAVAVRAAVAEVTTAAQGYPVLLVGRLLLTPVAAVAVKVVTLPLGILLPVVLA